MENKFDIEKSFYSKKTFLTEKNINENVKKYIYTESICVTNKI